MKKIYAILFFAGIFMLTGIQSSKAQCVVNPDSNGVYYFPDPNIGGSYIDFMCGSTDSLGTTGQGGFYNGDGYVIKLHAGTQVVFTADSLLAGPVSLTVVDSVNTLIAGAYSTFASPNTLTFTATYDGDYIIVMNLNDACAGGGTTLIGEIHVQTVIGTTLPPCAIQSNLINDTICGAIALTVDGPVETGNTANASATDPLDGLISASNFDTCSTPNNTMWYSFFTPVDIDTVVLTITSDVGSSFHSWIGLFGSISTTYPCYDSLGYITCLNGPDDAAGINTVSYFFPAAANVTYIMMVDGFSGSTGGFSLRMQSPAFFTGVADPVVQNDYSYNVYPNPASDFINVENISFSQSDAVVTLINQIGEVVFTKSYSKLSKERIDVSGQAAGLYTVKVTNTFGSFDKKIIINR